MQINPYLTFNGNCEQAFAFYADLFDVEIGELHRYRGSPLEEQVPDEFLHHVMHASMNICNIVLMGSDSTPDRAFAPIRSATLSISVSETEEAERIFSALSSQGTVTMPLSETFWAQRFGMLTDRFGTPWMVNCELPKT